MILAADFGGTTIKLGIVRDGTVLARRQLPAAAERPMPERLEAGAVVWEELLRELGRTWHDCQGAGLALPFVVDAARSRVLGDFGKFPGASEIDYAGWSRQRLGLKVALENDVRVALLGECAAGAARGKANVVMLAIGTGIGCAVISDHRLLRGAHNLAATLLGHSTIDHEGARGRCGNLGCAQDLASTATLAARARIHPTFAGSGLAHADKIDFATVFGLAAQGDACAERLLRDSLRVWAVVVQNLVLAYDPEIVVLGGGILRSAGVILPAIEAHLRAYLPALEWSVPVVVTALGDDAALIGAETLFRQAHPALFPEFLERR